MAPIEVKQPEIAIESTDLDLESLTNSLVEKTDYFHHEKRLSSLLKSRHISMIALVGVFGTGLFLSSGGTLAVTGPVGMLLAYIVVGLVVGANQICVTEVSCLMPVTAGYVKHAEHFVDEALGFTVGWTNVYSNIVPSELSAVAVVMTYWSDINSAAFIGTFGLVIVIVNCYNVRWYGEVEFFFGCLKVLLIVGLIISGLAIDLGGVSGQERLGFRYWRDPGPFVGSIKEGSLGQFIGFWRALSGVVYSFGGVQAISLLSGETEYPRRAIHRAAKRVFYRVFGMYLAVVFILTLIAPSNDPAIASPTGNAAGSPFVVAMKRAGIKVLPHIINGIVLTSALSAANLGVVSASRILFALATKGQAPKAFLKVNSYGLPWVAVAFSSAFLPLAFMSSSSASSTVFSWFQRITSSNLLFNWIVISVNHIFMTRAMKAQGYSRDQLPYRFRGAEFASWFSLFFSALFLLTGGFTVFIKGHWDFSSFFTSYFIIPLTLVLFTSWKFIKRTKYIAAKDVDLKALFQDVEDYPEPPYPKLKGWAWLTLLWA